MPVLPEASQLLFQSRRVEAGDSVVYPESTFFHFIARFRAAERPKVAAKSESRCVLGGVFFFRSSFCFSFCLVFLFLFHFDILEKDVIFFPPFFWYLCFSSLFVFLRQVY